MGKFQPALLGGLFIGVLSSLPIVSACCCLWLLGGGALVVYLQQQQSPVPVATGDAALQGLLAGAIGGVIVTIVQAFILQISGPMLLEQFRSQAGAAQLPPEMMALIERLLTGSGFAMVMVFITVPIYAVFSMAGAFIGLAIFRKKRVTTNN